MALVVIGGYALINALTSPSPGPGPSVAVSDTEDTGGDSGTQDPSTIPLQVTVTGPPTRIFVQVAGGGKVLEQGILGTGETRRYEETPLNVVVYDSTAVEVRIYGKLQQDGNGGRAQWTVPDRNG